MAHFSNQIVKPQGLEPQGEEHRPHRGRKSPGSRRSILSNDRTSRLFMLRKRQLAFPTQPTYLWQEAMGETVYLHQSQALQLS